MSKERMRILKMVSKGKLSVDEANNLLDALQDGSSGTANGGSFTELKNLPKFLYVQVDSSDDDNVNVRVPLGLIRAGMRLTHLIPPSAMDQVNASMEKQGMSIDLSNLTKEDIEVLVQSLAEMEVKVDSKNGDKVRVYCE